MAESKKLPKKAPTLERIRSVFKKERQDACNYQFEQFLKILEEREYKSEQKAIYALESLYSEWADKFELLKREFNDAGKMFQGMEKRLKSWYMVSPNRAKWQTVGLTRAGYNFATGIMKNHQRNAPRSEKSLTVSFALDEKPEGIGDERLLGYSGELSDNLVGLDHCPNSSLKEKGHGIAILYRQLKDKHLIFRLNHKKIGQQTAKLPFAVLENYSLSELCQGLFLALNNDIITEHTLNNSIENAQKLISFNAEPGHTVKADTIVEY